IWGACLLAVSPGWAVALPGVPPVAVAQESYPEPERCPRLVAALPRLRPAAFVVPVQASERVVAITYLGHSTFLIESPAGVGIATDYNDAVPIPVTPDIATMNRAHITHFTSSPDPAIAHVLKGWGERGVPAAYDLTVRDVWVRNVTTNLRGGFGDDSVRRDMNSMFVFEVAGLCIAHLGHLHHKLSRAHLDALGRIDVVMVPVDGSRTLGIDDMIAVLRDIQAPIVIPMHFFGPATLNRFMMQLEDTYIVERAERSRVTLSRETLPPVPTLLMLPGY
ncbi:MAG: MBL fold metallo-hydrolase, partial [Alphaproteobacteria bacterium]